MWQPSFRTLSMFCVYVATLLVIFLRLFTVFVYFESHNEKLSYLIDCVYKQVTVYQLSLYCSKAGRWFRDYIYAR